MFISACKGSLMTTKGSARTREETTDPYADMQLVLMEHVIARCELPELS